MLFSKVMTPPRLHDAGKPREPLYDFAELARHLDVKPGQLRRAMVSASLPFPSPRMTKGQRGKWWAMSEIIAWWVEIGGSQAAVSKRADYYEKYREKNKSILTA